METELTLVCDSGNGDHLDLEYNEHSEMLSVHVNGDELLLLTPHSIRSLYEYLHDILEE